MGTAEHADGRVNSGSTHSTNLESPANSNCWLADMERRRHEDLPPPYVLHSSVPKLPPSNRSEMRQPTFNYNVGNDNDKDVLPSYYDAVTNDAEETKY